MSPTPATTVLCADAHFDASAGLERLRRDLADGTWLTHNGALTQLQELDIGYRLVVAQCAEAHPSEPR